MFEEKAAFYKALAEPTRLAIIQYLLEKDACICICDLIAHVKKDQSVVSRHVQILKSAGIVTTNKDGKFLRCCLADKRQAKKLLEE